MSIAPSPSAPLDEDRRMGSEYASARSYLARAPRARVVGRKTGEDVQHGSNDSDFGMSDQAPD